MTHVYNKKDKHRLFELEDKVLKWIFPNQEKDQRGNLNWLGSFVIKRVLPRGIVIFMEMDEQVFPQLINSRMCKKFFI